MMNPLKSMAAHVLDAGYQFTARMTNRVFAPIIILAYHRVADTERDPRLLAVSRAHFAAHLAWLQENGIEALRFDLPWEPRLRSICACITFDDGYADNYHDALPILERYGFPATFFVSTGAVQSGDRFWWDALEHILYGNLPQTPPPLPFSGIGGPSREQLYQNAHGLLLRSPPEKQQHLLDSLSGWLGIERKAEAGHRPMTPAEVAALARHPLAAVGAHTHSHPRLAILSSERQKQEIATSLDRLERWTGKRPRVLAYPFGGRSRLGIYKDYTWESRRICKKLGLFRAAANYPGQARPWSNRFALPRHLVRDWDKETFARHFLRFQTFGYF